MTAPKRACRLIFFISLLLCSFVSFAQTNKQKELEIRRHELRKEIKKINELRAQNKNKVKSQVSLIENYNYKITVLANLIKVTNQQTNLLTREIGVNEKKITSLKHDLKELEKNYAAMIVKSYKSKNEQSRIMFLLSSESFKQAYKRLNYIKQYSEYQKQQGENIKIKTKELEATNKDLLKQQEDKKKLIAENRASQKTLEAERIKHKKLMISIKNNLSLYASQIKKKQREANRIDREIDKLIRAAIAKSNKKAGKKANASGFSLTAEEKVLASNFISNKGKLPWPVKKGLVKVRFGNQPSPIDKSLIISSKGVRIATEKGAEVRAVFNGVVSEIFKGKNINPAIIIRHGNYITLYSNLSKVYVKKGDSVTTKQVIGEVFNNPSNGETILGFRVSKGLVPENPANWIYKM